VNRELESATYFKLEDEHVRGGGNLELLVGHPGLVALLALVAA
jgi:hypothetical protein